MLQDFSSRRCTFALDKQLIHQTSLDIHAAMLATKLTATGQLINNNELMLVHLRLSAGETVAPHDHKGQEVFFTPVRGVVEVTLEEREAHTLTPGSVLHFAGESRVGVRAVEDCEFFVYLINRH